MYNVPQGVCREDSPVHPLDHSDRIRNIRTAENTVLEIGGNVIRLVGLYHAQRGAHTFFLAEGTVKRYSGSIINLIHYEDAAHMIISVRPPTRARLQRVLPLQHGHLYQPWHDRFPTWCHQTAADLGCIISLELFA